MPGSPSHKTLRIEVSATGYVIQLSESLPRSFWPSALPTSFDSYIPWPSTAQSRSSKASLNVQR